MSTTGMVVVDEVEQSETQLDRLMRIMMRAIAVTLAMLVLDFVGSCLPKPLMEDFGSLVLASSLVSLVCFVYALFICSKKKMLIFSTFAIGLGAVAFDLLKENGDGVTGLINAIIDLLVL